MGDSLQKSLADYSAAYCLPSEIDLPAPAAFYDEKIAIAAIDHEM